MVGEPIATECEVAEAKLLRGLLLAQTPLSARELFKQVGDGSDPDVLIEAALQLVRRKVVHASKGVFAISDPVPLLRDFFLVRLCVGLPPDVAAYAANVAAEQLQSYGIGPHGEMQVAQPTSHIDVLTLEHYFFGANLEPSVREVVREHLHGCLACSQAMRSFDVLRPTDLSQNPITPKKV